MAGQADLQTPPRWQSGKLDPAGTRPAAIDGDDGYAVLSRNNLYVTCSPWHRPPTVFRVSFFIVIKNNFVQLEDTKIKTTRLINATQSERMTVLHHSSLGMHFSVNKFKTLDKTNK